MPNLVRERAVREEVVHDLRLLIGEDARWRVTNTLTSNPINDPATLEKSKPNGDCNSRWTLGTLD